MKKYIVTAKRPEDIINLTINTKGVDLSKVKWDWTHISKSENSALCRSEQDILDAISFNEMPHVDDMIMGGDVPVGGMVVVYDGTAPSMGFVCANGNEWIVRRLSASESSEIVQSILKEHGSRK